MNTVKLMAALFFMAGSFSSHGQNANSTKPTQEQTKLVAVVNRANWCTVCKANGERFAKNIMPYTAKGLTIVMNDLTNDSTIHASKDELKKLSLYKQVYKTNRKGVGRMLQTCGLVNGKDKNISSGIVTFIDAKTLKVRNISSIAITDQEMKSIIDNLLTD